MNWQHLKTFVWLRWRLRANQRRRASTVNVVVETVLAVAAVVGAGLALLAGILAGALALGKVPPGVLMLVWDGVIAVFLLLWTGELLAELQRSEILSLERLLHLPVSLTGVFLMNYLGSFFCISGILFLPAMAGLSIGLVVSRGWMMVFLFPLVAALVLSVTAITYQFRGWLASLMSNQRRRRTIIALASVAFMIVTQLPNIWNMSRSRSTRAALAQTRQEIRELDRSFAAGQITVEEYSARSKALSRPGGTSLEDVQRVASNVNLAVPFGWLPYGAMSLAEGNTIPALMGTLGLALIGAASLRRSYSTTLRLYTGDFTSKKPRASVPDAKPARDSAGLIEKQIPWVSEYASAVALAGFRSLMRAPEAKMLLLSPVVLVAVFGSMFMRGNYNPPELLRPLTAAGGVTMLFFTMLSLAGNQFGFDRSGFRVFVLASAPRKDILLGKNLSLAPFVLGMALIVIVLLQFVYPMRVDHFLAVLLQLIPMYLVFSLVANFLSILAPMPIRQGSLKPASPKGMAILIHLGFFLLFPVAMLTTAIPLGVEFLLSRGGLYTWFPAYLVLTLAEVAVVAQLYPLILRSQGDLLQAREQRILEVVTSKVE